MFLTWSAQATYTEILLVEPLVHEMQIYPKAATGSLGANCSIEDLRICLTDFLDFWICFSLGQSKQHMQKSSRSAHWCTRCKFARRLPLAAFGQTAALTTCGSARRNCLIYGYVSHLVRPSNICKNQAGRATGTRDTNSRDGCHLQP